MSLETKIEELTKAVNLLTRAILERDIESLAPSEQSVESPTEKEAEPEPEKKAEQPARSQDDLKKLCMAKVKEDRAFKDTLKAFLSKEYGVTKTSEVPDDKVTEAYERIADGAL